MSFTAREASRLAGFEKPWMLNHLEREEIFLPEKAKIGTHGKHRAYSFRDLIVLRSINRLLSLGARPKRIRDSIRTFLCVCDVPEEVDGLLAFANSSSLFVVTGDKVFFCKSPKELFDLAKGGQLAFSFMIDSAHEIAPTVRAGLSYLTQVLNGAQRGEELLQATARNYGL